MKKGMSFKELFLDMSNPMTVLIWIPTLCLLGILFLCALSLLGVFD